MLIAYGRAGRALAPLPADAPLREALWIDLLSPDAAEDARLSLLGVEVPTLADMEEIEISNRLYREGDLDFLTVVIPGLDGHQDHISGPVTFILGPERLVSVRHHRPRPFETYASRADKTGPGCANPRAILLGLFEEIIGRQADLLEGAGRLLDEATRVTYGGTADAIALEAQLRRIGQQGELIGRVRLGLLTMERALGFLGMTDPEQAKASAKTAAALTRDIKALEVHVDFLTNRIALTNDVILGLITIGQTQTTKTVSVVAIIFLPPTLIASVYGMNFRAMPELDWAWGYPAAIGLMVASAAGAMAFFKWRRWL